MLLAVDVGNSHIVLGVYQGETLAHHWRLPTRRDSTVDETAALLQSLLDRHGVSPGALTAAAVSSVVPPLTAVWRDLCGRYLGLDPLLVTNATDTGLRLAVDHPAEVGADRIVNGVAAVRRYGAPVIVVDLGTATTVDAIAAGPIYLGGAIAPGVGVAAEALFQQAAQLFRVPLAAPPRAIGVNTIQSVQSGIVYGAAGQIDALVERVGAEMDGRPPVVATGGLAALVAPHSRTIDTVDALLTLDGLRWIVDRVACREDLTGG